MSEIYILKNQNQAYLDKNNEWITSGDRKQLFRTPHKDEALNMRVDWAVKHPEIRIEITRVALDEKGLPILDLPRRETHKEEDVLHQGETLFPLDQLPLENVADLAVTIGEQGAEIAPDNHNELNSEPGQPHQYPAVNQPADEGKVEAFVQPQELTDV